MSEGTTHLSIADLNRLVELVRKCSEETGRSPSEVIDELASCDNAVPTTGILPSSMLARFVDRLRRLRMRRNEMIGAPLFRDPAWDMLLELYAAHEHGRRLSVSSLCLASGVPLTTALRQLQRLEHYGMITREGDPKDNRRWYVQATPETLDAIGSATAMLIEHALDVAGVPLDRAGAN